MNNEILMCPNYLQMMFSLEQVAQKDIKFMDVCCVLLCRILCQLPYFQKFGKILPKHILHEFLQKMACASKVMPLPIQFKNEAEHEDCLAIMGKFEDQNTTMYQTAFGKYMFSHL